MLPATGSALSQNENRAAGATLPLLINKPLIRSLICRPFNRELRPQRLLPLPYQVGKLARHIAHRSVGLPFLLRFALNVTLGFGANVGGARVRGMVGATAVWPGVR